MKKFFPFRTEILQLKDIMCMPIVSEAPKMAEEKTITLEKLYAERFRTGEQLQLFRLKDMDKILCPDCSVMMKMVLPSVYFCSHCGNLISEEMAIPKLNLPERYYLTNLQEGLYTVRIAPLEQNVNIKHDMHHEVKLKPALKKTRKRTWLERDKKGRIQIEEGTEEHIEEKEEALSANVVQPKTNGSSEARESEG